MGISTEHLLNGAIRSKDYVSAEVSDKQSLTGLVSSNCRVHGDRFSGVYQTLHANVHMVYIPPDGSSAIVGEAVAGIAIVGTN